MHKAIGSSRESMSVARGNIPREVLFWFKVNKTDSCWLWIGAKTSTGYGGFFDGTRTISSHIFSYESLVGPVPSGKVLDHVCETPLCVNPAHLEPVTHGENIKRHFVRNPRTKCEQGHSLSDGNIVIRKGYKTCLACERKYQKEYYQKRKSAV